MGGSFATFNELFEYLNNDKDISKKIDSELFSDKNKAAISVDQAELAKYAEELKNMILDHMRADVAMAKPSAFNYGRIFQPGGGTFSMMSGNEMMINFSDKAVRRNKFDTHYSFMPFLYNFGWSVKGITGPDLPYPRFMYFRGSYFITDSIQEFNRKHKDDGVQARFMFGDEDITLHTTGKLDYKVQL